MVRKGIATLLADVPELEIVGEVSNGREAVDYVNNHPVDVVLMDILMPEMNGMEATAFIKKMHPKVKVLTITINNEYKYIKQTVRAGADGYLLKDTEKDDLVKAIEAVLSGKNYYSNEVLSKIVTKVASGEERSGRRHEPLPTLTNRELQVLKMVAKEYSNPEIADQLNISLRTVDTHKRNLLKKLKVKNVVGMVRYAIEHNLID